jgi:CheY-like chemotaxis protein
VADSGVGIKPEDQQKLFGEFIQVDTKRNRGIEGTGLGLAITKRLCAAMGGDISVESEYGRGSVFTARIPQKIAEDTPFASVENPGEKKTLVYERRMVYAKSVAWSLENMGVPHRLTSDIKSFAKALRDEEWRFVFSGCGLYDRIMPVMELAERECPEKKRPRLALMVEGGSEKYIPNARFLSLPPQTLSISDVLNGAPIRRDCMESALFTGTRFTAPGTRLLVVDDIATNLKVAEGLIAPYKADVDACLSGAEAVELVKHNQYDIVFMDHMMPQMDGVEAAELIRKHEKERGDAGGRQPVPIIALTANAVTGMREMFIEKGFNDFLAKPIDVSKLDEIIEKWLPKEKQIKTDGGSSSAAKRQEGSASLKIPGVNVKRGIAMTGGTMEGYKQVLSTFRHDAEERLTFLRKLPDESELASFVTQVHALKSALSSIGAEDASAEAARLELAGMAGESAFIRDALPIFAGHLAKLTEAIQAALVTDMDADARKTAESATGADYYPLLRELAGALGSENTRVIDRALEELYQRPLDAKAKASLEQISDHVLMAEFGAALEVTAALMNGKEGLRGIQIGDGRDR